jgi:pimeloyl-ACP methyl ester carboxylesterase
MTANDSQQRNVTANGIRMHFAEQGSGPLVLLCHGFPEGWYSWRDQLTALAAAGYHAIAPDMRGYGRTDAPPEISSYTVLDIVGDMIALVGALGEKRAIIVGHDWGANIAWHAALFRPDVFPAVAALSVPFRQRGPAPPLQMLRKAGQLTHYWFHFQEPGVAEAEFERDPRAALRRVLYSISGDAPPETRALTLQLGKGWLANSLDPERLPNWFTDADLDHMAAEFSRSGFRGGLNWYRNIDRNWELLAPFAGAKVTAPALYIAGDHDLVVKFPRMDQLIANLKLFVPNLTKTIMLPGCGHWTQQERAHEVNAALIAFLHEVG